MKYFKNIRALLSIVISLSFIIIIHFGCGNNANESTVISSVINMGTPVIEGNEFVIDSDDSYYIALEKKLNEELDVNRAPDKCAAQGLTKIVLNCTTDEIQTCSTYDLSKAIVTAYFSDKTAEVVTPTWSIYSGGGMLDGTVYTATNKPAIIVFKALYTENGISKLALFRLTVTGLTSISLSKTTDEIMLPATYDLSNELIITAKLSNGTTKTIVKGDPNFLWSLASGAGTLADGVYTPSAKVETAVFNASYSEAGVTKTAQFKLKVTGLSSLILSKTTNEINSCETYDLASKIVVSNKLSNGSINDITNSQNLTWTLSSGSGTLTNKIYTAPAKAETAVFTASYTEASITKTAQFRLKVTGLSSVVLDKTTDEIMLPATYDLASEIHANAKFSDGESQSVDLIWSLSYGSGVLSGSIYTPAPKPETAVFIGSYTENGITKTAQFRLKVIGLSSLTLSKTTDEVVSCATYDLSQIVVSDKLSNGTINNITNSTTWKLISGFGTLSDKTYTAPTRAETAVFTANYTEAGITKTAQFRLKIIALASIGLSKTTDEAQILAQYDLAANIAVTAKLSNGQIKPVPGNDPNLKWTLSFGSGVLSGTLYTPSEKIETAILMATYTENGVAQSAQLRLKSTATLRGKIELIGLTLNKTTDSVGVSQIYDLSKLIAIAKFIDKTTAEVALSWIVSSGGGFIAGTSYTAPNNVATVKLMGTAEAEDSSVKSVFLTLYVSDFKNEVISKGGGNVTLSNGITLEIPPDSVNDSAEISLSYIVDQKNNGIIFDIKTTNSFSKESYLKIPIDKVIPIDRVYANCFWGNSQEFQRYTAEVEIIENSSQKSPLKMVGPSRAGIIPLPGLIIGVPCAAYVYVKIVKPYVVPSGTAICRLAIRWYNTPYKPQAQEKNINVPYYRQYGSTCSETTALMMLKSYNKNSDWTVYKILKLLGIPKGWIVYKIKSTWDRLNPFAAQWEYNDQAKAIFELLGSQTGNTVSLYHNDEHCYEEYFDKIVESLDNGKPVIHNYAVEGVFNYVSHSIVIYGYKKNSNDNSISLYIHNPDKEPCEILTYKEFGQKYWSFFDSFMIIPANPSPNNASLQTIHIPDIARSGISCEYINKNFLKVPDYIEWDYLAKEGYSFYMDLKTNEVILPSDFINLSFDHFPIFNSSYNAVTGACLKIEVVSTDTNGNKKMSLITDKTILPQLLSLYGKFLENVADDENNLFYFHAYKLPGDLFRQKLKENKIEDNNYKILIDLCDSSENRLDGFDFKFKYTPPKSLLLPKKTGMYLNENYKIELKYGYDEASAIDVADLVEWSVEGGGTITGGVFKPNGPGTYKITAILRKGTKLSNNEIVAEDVTISFVINVNDAYINPAQKNININETVDFSLKYGTNEVDAADVTKITSWSADSGEIVVNNDGKAIYTPSTAGTFIITATLVKDTAFSTYEVVMENIVKTAEVTVSADLKIVPASKIMLPSESFKFAAMVDDATRETGIIWSAPDGGSITPVGLYTAPNNAGTYIVKASFGTVEATAEVTVMAADLKISPPAAVLNRSQQMTFKALVGDTTQETGISWSVVSLNGGSITQTGVYTAPAQWGKYVIKAAYQGIEATAEVKVNDERILLMMDNPASMSTVRSAALKADGTLLNSSEYVGFYVYGYGGDASTIELSIVEGQGKGRVQFVSKQYNTDWYWLPWKTRLLYYYYAPDSTQPLYDTNEIMHINAKCPDNSNTVAANSIVTLRPQLSDTQEVITNAGTYDERKWQFKSIGYRAQNGTWSNAAYKNSNMLHGLYLGIFTRNNMAAYIQHYYCGEATGEHLTYYNNPGDETHGKLATRYIYTDFIKYKYEHWQYTWENRYDPKTGYTTGPYKTTNKVTENYQRANINQSWSIILPQVFEKFDGWVTP